MRVIIVLNNCTDGSRCAALKAGSREPRLLLDLVEIDYPLAIAHVGSARRLAMECGFSAHPDPHSALILTTDADAVPAPDWIKANIRAIEGGADAVGGHILGNRNEEAQLGPGFSRRARTLLRYGTLTDQLAELIDPLPHDPWPRHRDHTGASLAVRADIYQAVGGLPALRFREDLALVSRVRAAGGRLRHPLDVKVEVSARLVGRAPGGMADCLKDWMRAEAEGRPLLVEAPKAVEQRLLRRRRLRQLDGAAISDFDQTARELAIDSSSLMDEFGIPLSSFALIEQFAPDEPDALACTPVDEAADMVRRMIALRGGEAFAA